MKTFKLIAAISFFVTVFMACNNNPNIEKPDRVVSSDSNPNLDSVSTDILKDPISTATSTVTPVNNEPTNSK
jgi:hypothetical protein